MGSRSHAFQRLRDLDALALSGRATTIVCQECDRRHAAAVTFDPERGAPTHFCREAGRVTIKPAALDVYEFRLDWLLAWIAKALRIPAMHRPIPRIEEHLWELGEATIDGHRVRLFFARRIGTVQILERLQQRLLQLSGNSKRGVVLTASEGFKTARRLGNAYSFVDIREVIDLHVNGVSIDRQRLLQIAEPEATINRYRTGLPGRPTAKNLILDELSYRIEAGVAFNDKQEEAAYLRAWLAEHHPDAQQPTIKTILNNIAEQHQTYRTHRILCPK